MFLYRKIWDAVKGHLDKKQITVITGMRRTGKTTLIKELLNSIPSTNKLYLDLERLDNRELFNEKNFDNIIVQFQNRGIKIENKAIIAIDEIQLVKGIPGVLKYLYDHYDFKFIVTGSSSYYLKDLFSESLSGRKQVFELFTLDFGEFLGFKGVGYKERDFIGQSFQVAEYERLKSFYEEYVQFGGFPEVAIENKDSDKTDILKDILTSYISIDIKQMSDFRKDREIFSLLRLLGSRVGSRVDVSKLSLIAGISRPTLANYLDFLEKTYLINRVSVFTRNRDKEIAKAQKLYISDNGLLSVLANVSDGAKFENSIYHQLKLKGTVQYFALKNGKEIDFVFDGKLAFETKESPTHRDLGSLLRLASSAGLNDYRLIGRYPVPSFNDYIWGGDIK